MNEKDYISSRVDKQIEWYELKSQSAQFWFKWLRIIEILSAAAIPVIAGFGREPFPSTIVVGILGAFIAVISAILSLNQFQENWVHYRNVCESLRSEKFLFLTQTEQYESESRLNIFVQRVESLILKENGDWFHNSQAKIEEIKTK